MGQLSVIRIDPRPYKLIMMWGGAGWLYTRMGKGMEVVKNGTVKVGMGHSDKVCL